MSKDKSRWGIGMPIAEVWYSTDAALLNEKLLQVRKDHLRILDIDGPYFKDGRRYIYKIGLLHSPLETLVVFDNWPAKRLEILLYGMEQLNWDFNCYSEKKPRIIITVQQDQVTLRDDKFFERRYDFIHLEREGGVSNE